MGQSLGLTKNSTAMWIGFTRILLSVLLLWKGLLFTQDASEFQDAIQQTAVGEYAGFLYSIAAVVSILTLVTCIFVMVGFFTRIASFIQMGIIILGVAFIYSVGIERNNFEVISTIVIFLLLLFLVKKGSGSISFDKVIRPEQ